MFLAISRSLWYLSSPAMNQGWNPAIMKAASPNHWTTRGFLYSYSCENFVCIFLQFHLFYKNLFFLNFLYCILKFQIKEFSSIHCLNRGDYYCLLPDTD